MINSIKFKNYLNQKTFILDLSNKVNIIVGEKGKGKSTLLRIIAEAILNKKMFKDGFNWLKDSEKILIDSVTIDGTEYKYDDFGSIFDKETKENTLEKAYEIIQNDFPSFISQNDKRKNSLDSSEYVEKQKEKNIDNFTNIIDKTINKKNEFKVFFDLYEKYNKYLSVVHTPISWQVIFKNNFFGILEKKDLDIFDIKYDSKEENRKIERIITKIENIESKISQDNIELESLYENLILDNDLFQISNKKIENVHEIINHIKNKNNEFLSILKDIKKEDLKKIKNTISCFYLAFTENKQSYTQKLNSIKNDAQQFKKMKDYFIEFAEIIKKIKNIHQSILVNDININWGDQISLDLKNSSISYRLENFKLDEEEKKMIFNKFLGSSNKSTNISDFLINYKDSGKDVDSEFRKVIKSLIKEKIKIYAGEKEYKTLSTGQKTLFGITHALETLSDKEKSNYLLLDQIEDNLDNMTIYKILLPKIQEHVKKGAQIFIVTHNANIGTLLEGNAIISDIFNDDINKKFSINTLIDGKEIPQSQFLEGGLEALHKRDKIYTKKINELKGKAND
ncbi:hypothetical protein [Metamycoplasma canadense]|nr:hypothetical protein [Metamycoplasma canadense]